jgi:hypothetical protein
MLRWLSRLQRLPRCGCLGFAWWQYRMCANSNAKACKPINLFVVLQRFLVCRLLDSGNAATTKSQLAQQAPYCTNVTNTDVKSINQRVVWLLCWPVAASCVHVLSETVHACVCVTASQHISRSKQHTHAQCHHPCAASYWGQRPHAQKARQHQSPLDVAAVCCRRRHQRPCQCAAHLAR